MLPRPERHPFLKAWLQDISEELDNGWYNVVPLWLALFLAISATAAFSLPKEFWTLRRDNSTVLYTGLLTMNGIILALSWSAFAKIYETIGASNFSAFLKENGVLEKFLFFVSFVHLFQLIALLTSAVGLIVTQFDTIALVWQRVMLTAMLGFGAYAIKVAAGSVTVMHDLIGYRAIFDADRAAKATNVHRLP